MDVVLGILRHVEIDHVRHTRDVEAARGDIGRDEHFEFAGLETLQRIRALLLAAVGVHHRASVAGVHEPVGDVVGTRLRAREDQHALVVRLLEEVDEQVEFLCLHDRIEAVRNRLGGRTLAADGDLERIAQRPRGELLDLGRQCRGEEQRLARLRHFRHDALHVGEKTHVEHAVNFVEHEDVDVVEAHFALLHEVEQAARRRGEDVHAVREILALLAVADAAVDDGHAQVGILGKILERLLDLHREFARGLEDEAAHLAVRREPLENRQRERRGLARARLCRADHVAAGEHHRDRLRLDRGRRLIAHLLHSEGEAVVEAERRERGVHLRHFGQRSGGLRSARRGRGSRSGRVRGARRMSRRVRRARLVRGAGLRRATATAAMAALRTRRTRVVATRRMRGAGLGRRLDVFVRRFGVGFLVGLLEGLADFGEELAEHEK